MKTTKEIIAALLVVMMLAMMIPFSASAAESYTYTITGKAGYTFSVYKVADLNTTTGEYSGYDDSLETILTTKSTNGVDSAALLTACDKLGDSVLGSAVQTHTFASDASGEALTQTETVTNAGIYYVKVTGTPAGTDVKSVKNSVFSLPYYSEGNWVNTVTVNAGTKIEDGTPTVKKEFTNYSSASSISEFIGNDVSFTLTGSIVGSKSEKAQAYKFVDTMSAGLTFKSITSVRLTGTGINDRLLANNEYTYAETGTDDNSFTVELDSSILNDDLFYDYTNVVVVYTATVDADAVIGGEGNPNEVDLVYTNSYGNESTIEGNKVTVYTFDLDVVKVDAANNETKLSGAGFTLYTNSDCSTVATNGAEQTTGADGKATFTGVKAGTYYLKETTAPAGYNLNATVFTIVISENGTVTSNGSTVTEVTVPDTLLVVPETGGMGTMMFTIGGAALIACAGVLFLIVRRKKSAE